MADSTNQPLANDTVSTTADGGPSDSEGANNEQVNEQSGESTTSQSTSTAEGQQGSQSSGNGSQSSSASQDGADAQKVIHELVVKDQHGQTVAVVPLEVNDGSVVIQGETRDTTIPANYYTDMHNNTQLLGVASIVLVFFVCMVVGSVVVFHLWDSMRAR